MRAYYIYREVEPSCSSCVQGGRASLSKAAVPPSTAAPAGLGGRTFLPEVVLLLAALAPAGPRPRGAGQPRQGDHLPTDRARLTHRSPDLDAHGHQHPPGGATTPTAPVADRAVFTTAATVCLWTRAKASSRYLRFSSAPYTGRSSSCRISLKMTSLFSRLGAASMSVASAGLTSRF